MIYKIYAALPGAAVKPVDEAFTAARSILMEAGFEASTTDAAERLVEAIAVYLKESNPRLNLGPEPEDAN